MSTLGNRLKLLRKEKDITQDDLAKVCHVERVTVTNWEIGRAKPDIDTLKIMADYFNVSTDYLLCRTEDRTPPQAEPKAPYDWRIILQQPDMGRAYIVAHDLKRKYNVPQEEYDRWEDEIINHYGKISAVSDGGKVAHDPGMPGSGIFENENQNK